MGRPTEFPCGVIAPDGAMIEKFKTICHVSADVAKAPCIVGTSRLGFPSFTQELEVVYT